jgi:hypothetical protein
MNKEVFHEGEIAVQERAGERSVALRNGRGIAQVIMPEALPFLAQQRLIAISTCDAHGAVWVAVWFGPAGFIASDDGRRVTVARTAWEDPVSTGMRAHGSVGILAIELATRKRLRINGVVESIERDRIEIDVREAFGNCPKYIQRRIAQDAGPLVPSAPVASGRTLDAVRCAAIASADTLFVGSVHPERGADASHRGGAPGFVRVSGEASLRIPDYRGNGMFQTLGNFATDARASIAVADFDRARVLSMTGTATLAFDGEDPAHPTGGTGRYWDFQLEEWREVSMPAGLHYQLIDAWRFNPPPFGGGSARG